MIESLLGLAIVLLLLFLGMPLAVVLGAVGYVGFGLMVGFGPSGAMAAQIAWDTVASYGLSVLPMFVLMGNLVNHAGLSRELYDASNAFVGHRKGGQAMATILACAGFGAVCGSSVATAATFAKISLPAMRRFGYSEPLAVGAVASGGTLGIMIPPSVPMVIYGGMTETSVGKLFIAGILPGLLGALLYIAAVKGHTLLDRNAGPAAPRTPWRERFIVLGAVWPTIALFVVVIGGIYVGAFTAVEAAGIGATGAMLIAMRRGLVTLDVLVPILTETARTTAMLMAVLIGALIFSNFIAITGISGNTANAIKELNVSPAMVIALIAVLYLVLGCLLEPLSMILLTVPVLFPLVIGLGYDPVWFGILVVVMIEVGMITPPVGMNLFVIQAMSGVSTMTMYKGVWPFIVADIVRVIIIVSFPAFVLLLPNRMG